jgi:hypothetical protein
MFSSACQKRHYPFHGIFGMAVKIQNGRSLSFDKLLIASGADPRPIKTPRQLN